MLIHSFHYCDQDDAKSLSLQYWRNELEGVTPILSFRHLPQERGDLGAALCSFKTVLVSAAIASKLKKIAHEKGVTLYGILLAAFQITLSAFTTSGGSQAQGESLKFSFDRTYLRVVFHLFFH